jgi:hypothetical protein
LLLLATLFSIPSTVVQGTEEGSLS